MTSYRDAVVTLVAGTETRAGALHDAYDAGEASRDEWTAALSATLLRAEQAAVGLADLALAVELTRRLRHAVPTLGLVTSNGDRQATRKAVDTLTARLTETGNPRARALRLARGRVTQTGGRYYDVGLAGHREVTGYTRGLSPTACELCQWLYRGGHVYPASQPMHRHSGCTCVPIPTLRGA